MSLNGLVLSTLNQGEENRNHTHKTLDSMICIIYICMYLEREREKERNLAAPR